ncbi:putative linoleate 9S-lipoxygenase 5 [Platanthera zijinensis]|uniref:Lipoxygenase n=1 Tax=Platanthera zijinensis TaxID=2320716 RepID=A0AAP0BU95_9ASPA
MIRYLVKDILTTGSKGTKVKAKVVMMNKNVLDFNDFNAAILNQIQDFLGQKVEFVLVSATVGDPNNGNRGVVGKPAYLEPQLLPVVPKIVAGEKTYVVTFTVDENQGIPGAVIVRNRHLAQFYLKSITIENFPGKGRIHFDCNSWVYNADKYSYDRIFFANYSYLPNSTPEPLRPYRQDEMRNLRGDSVNRRLEEWDRVYSYAYYNDLGNPDANPDKARPVLGGSAELPYPRRGKTGRPPSKKDPRSESRLGRLELESYVPRDERFGHIKMSDFVGQGIKTVAKDLLPIFQAVVNFTMKEFASFKDVLKLYEGGLPLPDFPLLRKFFQALPFTVLKSVLISSRDQQSLLKLPIPQVIQNDRWAWRTDEEFARQMLAGVNPVIIQLLREFPPMSTLDPCKYGDQNSTIKPDHIRRNIDGLSVQQALELNRLFILDHHDTVMPYLREINSTDRKVYASRTLLFLNDDGTLRPIAIELSLPHPGGDKLGATSTIYTPSVSGVEASIWNLAKAYVVVNDSCIHQLISHWLRTHAVIEPFIIATNRQLSTMHPINKLLVPHYRDTMNINALARQTLVNAGGLLEFIIFATKHAMEMSSVAYKRWNFVEQSLPCDLLKRGMAVKDPSAPHKLRLLIDDYPYAVDGLSIWSAIENWVAEYTAIYYADDSAVQHDEELQAWWKEVREVGHGDLKDEAWWPEMTSVPELVNSCATIIWVASAMHAAVNFGQYPYAGYLPNRPTVSLRFMPEEGSVEYEKLRKEPEREFLKTIACQLQTIIGISLVEVLSTHASDEVYLGQRVSAEWTRDEPAIDALNRFGAELKAIERRIAELNRDPSLKNRAGPVKMPYLLLSPYSEAGITGKGIPNSISI